MSTLHARSDLTLMNGPAHLKMTVSNAIVALFPPYRTPASVPLRALKYAPNITLSFVVLNEDSTSGSYVQSWDVSSAIKGLSRQFFYLS